MELTDTSDIYQIPEKHLKFNPNTLLANNAGADNMNKVFFTTETQSTLRIEGYRNKPHNSENFPQGRHKEHKGKGKKKERRKKNLKN